MGFRYGQRSEGIPRPLDKHEIKISDDLIEFLDSERLPGEFRYTTIIERILRERSEKIKVLRQEIEDLKSIVKSLGWEV